jgi:hypothetical protein
VFGHGHIPSVTAPIIGSHDKHTDGKFISQVKQLDVASHFTHLSTFLKKPEAQTQVWDVRFSS